jgi:hypothetical protein
VEGIAGAARGFLKTNIEEKGDSAALIEIESISFKTTLKK